MGKNNGYLARQQAAQAAREARSRDFTIQQCLDMAIIALHDEFGFGPERIARFVAAYSEAFKEYATLTLADAKVDKAIEFTKGKVDRALKAACGEHFVPWEVRYGP